MISIIFWQKIFDKVKVFLIACEHEIAIQEKTKM